VELFAAEAEEDSMKGINKAHLVVNGELHNNINSKRANGSYSNKSQYEYFDDPLVENRTVNEYDKYEFKLYTHPSGVAEDGYINLNIVNLEFMLGLKNPGVLGIDDTVKDDYDTNDDGVFDTAEWDATAFNTDGTSGASAAEINASGLDKDGDGVISGFEWAGTYDTNRDGVIDAAEWTASGFDNGAGANTGNGIVDADEIAASGFDINGDGSISSLEWKGLYAEGQGRHIDVGDSINLAGLNQTALDSGDGAVNLSNDPNAPVGGLGLNYQARLTDEDGDGTEGDGYIKDITQISIEEFTNIIEKIADIRAENGAEQARVNQSLSLHQNNLVNLQAAHGRIVDVDVAMESTRLARHSVTVQASAAMVAQANQMTAVALTLLSN
jgi:flagellin-like hook-associated protein FlgL